MDPTLPTRRNWLRLSSFGLGGVAASWLLKQDGLLAAEPRTALEKPELEPTIHDLSPKAPLHEAKAHAMISMYMLGGPSQIDLFDFKPELVKRNGQDFAGKIKWDNAAKTLSLGPASKQTATRTFQVELIPDGVTRLIQYSGRPLELKFQDALTQQGRSK